ncbi:hypothetical protein EOD42_18365 [Rhodovarius crocodyli]|uniref:Uncharacterized protein n=1 Tax=Rhodovarius crocodyli TaxID=1979269 RepID=A0A437M3A1_9PROT|nr:hypothetical protein [Rhodovarius crocodyli]RVT89641.1 hypothetical protein EOD42_24910 [Rhodovarius crocodyli]RVT92181.1 hypothetical protein EOD42_18365 [Rhodovarius crocodyli]
MNRFAFAAAAISLMASAPAFAQSPRLEGDFASQHVVYDDSYRGNIVGGGAVAVIRVDEGRPVLGYASNGPVQQGVAGMTPVVQNIAGTDRTVWVNSRG